MALVDVRDDNPFSLVKQWQEKIPLQSSPAELGAIGQLYEGCVVLGKSLVLAAQKQSMLSSREQTSLRRSIERLCLWGYDHGTSNGELDHALQDSKRLRQAVLEYLIELGGVLSKSTCAPLGCLRSCFH